MQRGRDMGQTLHVHGAGNFRADSLAEDAEAVWLSGQEKGNHTQGSGALRFNPIPAQVLAVGRFQRQ